MSPHSYASSLPWVRTLVEREVVGSTSDLARELVLAGGVELPLAVRADRQTRGRGRGTHAWWSDAGSLTFTVALDPAAHGLAEVHEPALALTAAVAIIDAVQPLAPAAVLGIRWPNDVEAAGRKLAGILPERVDTPRGRRLLIGIGLNVTTRLDDAPPEVGRMATTVERLAGNHLDPKASSALFGAILDRFGETLGRLASDDASLPERWRRLDLLRGEWVQVHLGPRIDAGWGAGIDDRGALRLRTERGELVVTGGQVLRDPRGGGVR